MIIHRVELEDFGIYGGEFSFDLTPASSDGYNRPIVLFNGKNGAGKTTLIEAIRLCLHGPLSLGNRVGQADYEDHLARCIHVPPDLSTRPSSARVGLSLEYVSEGRKQTYRIERTWQLVRDKIKLELGIWQGDHQLTEFDTIQQKENFLRELVPPRVADLFFFDGEKLGQLAQDDTSSSLLADTVHTLLGLHLVEQLQKDLDIYVARQITQHEVVSLQTQLEELVHRVSDLERRRLALQAESQANRQMISDIQRIIIEQERRIASEGNWFAERLNELNAAQQRLEAEIEIQRRQAQELGNGLMPFAIAPQMCQRVTRRLGLEARYEQGVASQQVLRDQLALFSTKVASPVFWADVDADIDEPDRQRIMAKFEDVLKQTIRAPSIDPKEIVLRVSDQDRQTLASWIDQSLTDIPLQFCRAIHRLDASEAQLEQVNQDLQLVPADETLKPLVETLHRYNQDLGALQKTDQDLTEQIDRLEYDLERAGYRLKWMREQIAEQEHHHQRIQLASRAQLALEAYTSDLNQAKIALLEERLTVRFNDLCRKQDLSDAIKIDPNTFRITLYRQQQPFTQKQLSAGEKQLLAVAIMWALREVSRVPMPVIIDTPLGRLDSDHRLSMVQRYFPQASHQVILLATDTEVDEQTLSRLRPAISHMYHLEYDATQGRTVVYQDSPVRVSAQKEVPVR
jgi:DNA sulfur modification protein DndD